MNCLSQVTTYISYMDQTRSEDLYYLLSQSYELLEKPIQGMDK